MGVIGIARSGYAAALLAAGDGFSVIASDVSDDVRVRKRAEELRAKGIEVELGGHSDRLLDVDIIVVSPGVPLEIDVLRRARDRGVPVISELEFAFRHEMGRVVAVTGSNGKSTTATLVHKILSASGMRAILAGNIGRPYSAVVTDTAPDSVTVLEVSSFQLEAIDSFRPFVAALLNLSPDHLDRYATVDDYYRAKTRIFANQGADDFAVLNADQDEVLALGDGLSAQKLFFSARREVRGAWVKEGMILLDGEEVLPASELGIPGPHNLCNALAALAAAKPLGLDISAAARALREFEGIEHRLERFLERDGVLFVNDSKATNPDALMYALMSFDRPIVLIAGGYDKGADFSHLRELFARKVKAAVFTGATGEAMAHQLGDAVLFAVFVPDFERAVERAVSLAEPGDVVMLSPGCASFDAFENFEHRGKVFKELVRKIVGR